MTVSPSAKRGAPGMTLRYRPRSPPGTRTVTRGPKSPFRYAPASMVTSVSMRRRPSAHCASIETTWPRTMTRADRVSSTRSAGATIVA